MKRLGLTLFLAIVLACAPSLWATNPTASYTCTSTGSTAIAPVFGARRGFQIQNTGATINAVIAIATNNACVGSPPNGYVITPGQVYKLPDGAEPVPTGDISCCTASGSTTVVAQDW